MRFTTIDAQARIWSFAQKRLGRPKGKWIAAGTNEVWRTIVRDDPDTRNAHLTFNTSKTNRELNQTITKTIIDHLREDRHSASAHTRGTPASSQTPIANPGDVAH